MAERHCETAAGVVCALADWDQTIGWITGAG